jgi:dTDP-4-amino-4,6-dideoxygalactose transaminase
MTDWRIPFNRPFITGDEFGYIREAIANLHLSGNGPFGRRCAGWLEERTGTPRALMTHSCTAALEMTALLARVRPGDEVIMPSFTFVTTATAFALSGATPVFVDIRPDTLNLDERLVEEAITPATRAIVAVHYAGVGCEMDALREIADRHELLLVEDAAQALGATYRGRPLGTLGDLGALSFHETKNVTSGEGGALLVNDPELAAAAEVIQEKGTNRSAFFRGQVDKYTWVDMGSSYVLSDIAAAFLWAQLEHMDEITAQRRAVWSAYHERFEELEQRDVARRPVVPAHCEHNAHLYYLLLRDEAERTRLMGLLGERGIASVFHYVPLHSSPAGSRIGRAAGPLVHTDDASDRLLRLPLWAGMGEAEIEAVTSSVYDALVVRA